MNDYVIIANGPFLPKEIILTHIQNKMIVALDGAADKLMSLNITPHVVLGDFDSISHFEQKEKIQFISLPDQNYTDLQKGIRYCDTQMAASITILCASGGRMDHHENALRSLRTEYKKNRPMLLHTDQQTLRFAKDEELYIEGSVGDKCGILAYPAGRFSSKGLQYDVTDFELVFGFADSTSNSLKEPRAWISVTGEALIVMPLSRVYCP